MMEPKTDRKPYWEIAKLIIGITMIIVFFHFIFPILIHINTGNKSDITKQTDRTTKTADQKYKDIANGGNSELANNRK